MEEIKKENERKENERICTECGRIIEDGESFVEFDGKIFCENCAETELNFCENCGNYEYRNYIGIVHVGDHDEIWCSDCIRISARRCYECGELFSYEYANNYCSDNGCYYCDSCAGENLWWCDECDEYHLNGNDCPNENVHDFRVKSYHDSHKRKRTFFGSGKMYIGTELEIDSGYKNKSNDKKVIDFIEEKYCGHFNYENDGSLEGGFEIISEPHSPEEYLKINWEEILRNIADADFSSHDSGTCGLHVHINRSFFGSKNIDQQRNIAKMTYFYNKFYGEIVRFSRRNRDQLDEWANPYPDTRNVYDILKRIKEGKFEGRYHAVNLTNENTVEIRIMRGTLNPKTYRATIDFITRIARNACKITYRDVDNLNLWLKGLKPETIEYMKYRKCFGF